MDIYTLISSPLHHIIIKLKLFLEFKRTSFSRHKGLSSSNGAGKCISLKKLRTNFSCLHAHCFCFFKQKDNMINQWLLVNNRVN